MCPGRSVFQYTMMPATQCVVYVMDKIGKILGRHFWVWEAILRIMTLRHLVLKWEHISLMWLQWNAWELHSRGSSHVDRGSRLHLVNDNGDFVIIFVRWLRHHFLEAALPLSSICVHEEMGNRQTNCLHWWNNELKIKCWAREHHLQNPYCEAPTPINSFTIETIMHSPWHAGLDSLSMRAVEWAVPCTLTASFVKTGGIII